MSAYVNPVVILSALLVTLALFLNRWNILANLGYWLIRTLDNMLCRRLVGMRKLVVESKYEVPAKRYNRLVSLRLDASLPVIQYVEEYPEKELWVIGSSVRVIGPIHYEALSVSVKRSVYMSLAPGDTMDNPHFGGVNREAWVDPELSHKYRPSR